MWWKELLFERGSVVDRCTKIEPGSRGKPRADVIVGQGSGISDVEMQQCVISLSECDICEQGVNVTLKVEGRVDPEVDAEGCVMMDEGR